MRFSRALAMGTGTCFIRSRAGFAGFLALPCLLFLAGLFSPCFLFWLFAFWTGSKPTGFLPVDLGPLFVPGGFVGLSGPDRGQRKFSALAF